MLLTDKNMYVYQNWLSLLRSPITLLHKKYETILRIKFILDGDGRILIFNVSDINYLSILFLWTIFFLFFVPEASFTQYLCKDIYTKENA